MYAKNIRPSAKRDFQIFRSAKRNNGIFQSATIESRALGALKSANETRNENVPFCISPFTFLT